MTNSLAPELKGQGLRIAVVWSRFNEELVRVLLTACDRELVALGVAPSDIDVVSVPGALEIPLVLQALAFERRGLAGRRYDALVALGAVVRGETYHFEIVSNESARGIMDLSIGKRLAIGNGILTVEDEAQAWARARITEGDKGGFAARACLDVIALKRRLLGAAR